MKHVIISHNGVLHFKEEEQYATRFWVYRRVRLHYATIPIVTLIIAWALRPKTKPAKKQLRVGHQTIGDTCPFKSITSTPLSLVFDARLFSYFLAVALDLLPCTPGLGRGFYYPSV
jgi:hypothetical protein